LDIHYHTPRVSDDPIDSTEELIDLGDKSEVLPEEKHFFEEEDEWLKN